jgi:predicted flap endonuclease-1-like 5' DNA nuclease
MDYKIDEIEGIGPVYGEKLKVAGINSVANLLEKCAGKKGRVALANENGIDEKLILKWTNHADLFRINGIGPQFSELLEEAGVDTVKELRTRNAENLYAKIQEVNGAKKLVRRLPSLDQLTKMIEEAGKSEVRMTY